MSNFLVGHAVRFTAQFTDGNTGALYDPPIVRYRRRAPHGAVTTYVYGVHPELQRESVGRYAVVEAFSTPQSVGRWHIRFEAEAADGAAQAAAEQEIMILPSVFV